jgi:flagellar assembly protein FliH
LSNLIKRGERSGVRIGDFHVEEIGELCGNSLQTRRSRLSATAKDKETGLPQVEQSIHEKLARIEREAYEKGFEQGQMDGLALGEKRVAESLRQMEVLLKELGDLKGQIYSESEQELVLLSVEIARQIVKAELKIDPGVVTRSIRAALNFLTDKGCARVLISPDDMNEVQKYLPELARMGNIEKLTLVEDGSIEKGGCVLETGFGKINAMLDSQIASLHRVLEEEFQCRNGDGDEAIP